MPDWPVQTEEAVWEEHIYQFQLSDPLFGGPVIDPVTKQGIDNFPLMQLANRTTYLRERIERLVNVEEIDVTVGSSGDFATINAALEELTRYRSAYLKGGLAVTLTLQAGFVMEEQVQARGIDLSWLRITGVEAETVIARDALTVEPIPGGGYPAFGADEGAALPVIDQLFTMTADGSGSERRGIRLGLGRAVILPGAGVKNAGSDGLAVTGASQAFADGAIFDDAGDAGVRVTDTSFCQFSSGFARDAASIGLFVWRGSICNAESADVSGAAVEGARSRRGAVVNFRNGNARKGASDSSDDITVSEGGIMSAGNSTGGTSVTPNEISSSGIIFQ